MAFNISQFLQGLPLDGARPNLFDLTFTFPQIVDLGSLAGQQMTVHAKSAQLPGATVGMAPLFYFGREIKLAGNRQWQDWTVQIINDEDFTVRNAFEQWANAINDPVLNVRDPGASRLDGGYGSEVMINHYGKDGSTIKQYAMVGMFPLDVAPIDLDWGANDQIEEFVVTLAYQYGFDPRLTNPGGVDSLMSLVKSLI